MLSKPTFEISTCTPKVSRFNFIMTKGASDKLGSYNLINHIKQYADFLLNEMNILHEGNSKFVRKIDFKFVLSAGRNVTKRGQMASNSMTGKASIEIRVGNIKTIKDLFEVIAHEIVHLKQFYYGELITGGVVSRWEGPEIINQEIMPEWWKPEYRAYRLRPQEIEANANSAYFAYNWKLLTYAKSNFIIDFDKAFI